MKKIAIYGASGFGREVACLLERINDIKPEYEILGFLDDGITTGTIINDYPVLGNSEWILENKENVECICAIANVNVKARIQEELTNKGVKFATVIAPDVFVPRSSTIGKGCVISWQCRISVNVTLEDGVFFNSGVAAGHDVHVGKYSTIFPNTGISGCCDVGNKVLIGGHSFIVPGKKIGDGATVAAGSIVFSNVKANTTVLGNPAKRMKAIE